MENAERRAAVKAAVVKWVPPTLLLLFVAKHFAPRGDSKQKAKEEQARHGKEVKGNRKYFRSALYAVQSSTLRNMLLGALGVSYASKRLFGFRAKRVFPAFFATIWAMIYFFRVVEAPKVWFRRTYFNSALVEKAKLTKTEFWPVFWLFNRHAQTVTCYVISAFEWLWARPIQFHRETIPCHDPPNEQFIDWAYYGEEFSSTLPGQSDRHFPHQPPRQRESASTPASSSTWQTPIILCVHGLGDNRDIPYLKRFSRTCLRNGWRVAIWSYWRFQYEESRDLKMVVDHIHSLYPRAPIVGVAWSAGAYYLTRYLQKAGANTPMVCAICNSGCLDFVQAVEDVTTNENTTYPLFLLGQAHVCIRRHIKYDKRIKDKKPFERLFLEEFDPMRLFNKFYSMLPEPIPDDTGFGPEGFVTDEGTVEERVKNAPHYVARAIDQMDRIKVTTLLLHAEDDPVVSYDHVHWGKVENNRHIIVCHTHRGGHCAWHEGLVPFGDTWGDRVSSNFISAVLETHSQTHFIVELVRQAMSSAQFFAQPRFGSGLPRVVQGSFGRDLSSRGGTDQDDAEGFDGGVTSNQFSPQAMARICSASDLASMGGTAPLTMKNKGNVTLFEHPQPGYNIDE